MLSTVLRFGKHSLFLGNKIVTLGTPYKQDNQPMNELKNEILENRALIKMILAKMNSNPVVAFGSPPPPPLPPANLFLQSNVVDGRTNMPKLPPSTTGIFRPVITVEDILNVKLKKTSHQKGYCASQAAGSCSSLFNIKLKHVGTTKETGLF